MTKISYILKYEVFEYDGSITCGWRKQEKEFDTLVEATEKLKTDKDLYKIRNFRIFKIILLIKSD